MSPTKLAQRPHDAAVIAALESVGLAVGDGVRNTRPDGTGETIPPPCCVVHPLPGGGRFGTLDDWVKHAELLYQVTCVGETREQAIWVRDQTEVLFDGITVAGRHIDVVRADFGSAGAVLDDTARPLVWISMPHYRFTSSPA